MDLIHICNILEKEDLPIPIKQCSCCGDTIYRHRNFYRCCKCGATSTQFGGIFTHTLFSDVGIDQVWVDSCNKSKKRIEELKSS